MLNYDLLWSRELPDSMMNQLKKEKMMGNKKKYGDFFEEYLERGFGKVKAADLEVMIFHWYMEKRRVSDEKLLSPFNLSLDLSVPISKVKDLMYKESGF